jgi:hypothetical protein
MCDIVGAHTLHKDCVRTTEGRAAMNSARRIPYRLSPTQAECSNHHKREITKGELAEKEAQRGEHREGNTDRGHRQESTEREAERKHREKTQIGERGRGEREWSVTCS